MRQNGNKHENISLTKSVFAHVDTGSNYPAVTCVTMTTAHIFNLVHCPPGESEREKHLYTTNPLTSAFRFSTGRIDLGT